MKTRTKLIQEGEYAAAVTIEFLADVSGWDPCITLADAEKLDEVRAALRSGDFHKASIHGQIYRLTPLSA